MNAIYTKIAGVSFNGRQAYLKNLSIGDPLVLVREPDNNYDENAIKVTTIGGVQLGYIKAKLAEGIAPLMDKGSKFICKVLELTGGEDKNLGCNIIIRREKIKYYPILNP